MATTEKHESDRMHLLNIVDNGLSYSPPSFEATNSFTAN